MYVSDTYTNLITGMTGKEGAARSHEEDLNSGWSVMV